MRSIWALRGGLSEFSTPAAHQLIQAEQTELILSETGDRLITSPHSRAPYALGLAVILVGAAVLRLWGINWGLPNLYHWDERAYFHSAFYSLAAGGRAESLVSGNVPYLMIPALWAVAFWRGLPLWGDGISRLVTVYLSDPSPFYLIGRLMWVGIELLTVWLLYRVGSRALSRRAGLLAAAFLSVAFLAVSEGHYVKGDTTALFGAVLTAWAALRLLERPTLKWYALLGVAVGLTVSFKFYTYTLAVTLVVAHMMVWPNWTVRRRQWRLLLVSAVCALLAFVVTLPTIVIDPIGTWDTLTLEAGVTLASLPTGGVPIWLYYWTGHLWDGLGWPLELCGLAGIGLWLFRRDKKRMVLLLFPALLWVGIVTRENQFARYTLPIVPFLALAAGDLLDRAAGWVGGRMRSSLVVNVGLAVAAGLVMLLSLANDLRFDVYASSPDTRTVAARWVEKHIPAGATVVEEGGQGFEAVSNLGPPLRADPAASGITWAPTKLKPQDEYWSVPLLRWLESYTPTYKMTFAPTLTRYPERTTTEAWGTPDAFVIISWRSDPEKGMPPSPLWEDLRREYTLSARFDCSPCFPNDPYAWAIDYDALAQVSLRSGTNVGGPRVWVYVKKGSGVGDQGSVNIAKHPPTLTPDPWPLNLHLKSD